MLSEGLTNAVKNLMIQDVYFGSIDARVVNRQFFNEEAESFDELKPMLQQKFGVKKLTRETVSGKKYVYFTFEAGLRWTIDGKSSDTDKLSENEVLAYIESNIVACYQLKDDVPEEFLKEYAFKNSGIHVWPYWREFLSTTSERLKLPRVMLPTVQFQTEPLSEST